MRANRRRSEVLRALVQIFYHVPVIGWLTKDAVHGSPEARYFFGFNLLMAMVGLVYLFGYPLVITLALIGAGAGLSGLVLLTAGDAFDRRASQVSVATPAPPRRERPNLARAA
jgi:hypothetical protein